MIRMPESRRLQVRQNMQLARAILLPPPTVHLGVLALAALLCIDFAFICLLRATLSHPRMLERSANEYYTFGLTVTFDHPVISVANQPDFKSHQSLLGDMTGAANISIGWPVAIVEYTVHRPYTDGLDFPEPVQIDGALVSRRELPIPAIHSSIATVRCLPYAPQFVPACLSLIGWYLGTLIFSSLVVSYLYKRRWKTHVLEQSCVACGHSLRGGSGHRCCECGIIQSRMEAACIQRRRMSRLIIAAAGGLTVTTAVGMALFAPPPFGSNRESPHLLAALGDVAGLERCIEGGMDMSLPLHSNTIHPLEGASPLICAAWNGHIAAVKCLVDCGVDIDAYSTRGDSGINAIRAAAIRGHSAVLEMLLGAGAKVDAPVGAWSIATLAAQSGSLRTMRVLLDRGISLEPTEGITPLQQAAFHGDAQMCSYLLSWGARINGTDANGVTPLMLACAAGHLRVVRMLLESGADPALCDAGGDSAVFYLAFDDCDENLLHSIIEYGADVDARSPTRNNMTVLIAAVIARRVDLVEYLISRGADILAADALGRSALEVADDSLRDILMHPSR